MNRSERLASAEQQAAPPTPCGGGPGTPERIGIFRRKAVERHSAVLMPQRPEILRPRSPGLMTAAACLTGLALFLMFLA